MVRVQHECLILVSGEVTLSWPLPNSTHQCTEQQLLSEETDDIELLVDALDTFRK